ncbi:MAG: pirin family protein, partial [Leifsonia sp.]
MSNLERDPAELLASSAVLTDTRVEILEPRDVPLGGPRAMSVRRTLPQRRRSLIGGWCFIDHYGPDDVSVTGGMRVPPHPHTGLQTVSWLFEGEIDHRDSVGSHALVRPGELNLMTAGRGISHSEVSTAETTRLHGVQLWVALPSAAREVAPFFEHHTPVPGSIGAATVKTFVGSLAGSGTTATVFSPLVGAEILVPAGTTIELPLDVSF